MSAGLSPDLVFRVQVREAVCLLRIMTVMDERFDPARIFASMQIASDAGLTPRVLYTNSATGISLTEFVEAVPFPQSQALQLLPETLCRLHQLPSFPKTFNWMTAHTFFIWRFRGAGLLPAAQLEQVYPLYEQICHIYPRVDSDIVSCHMDLKPENILFDGQRPWLIDWQAAFLNDRYFDLAILGNFLITSAEQESTFLQQYFGQPATTYQSARFHLMQQAVHLFSAAVFCILGAGGSPINQTEPLPDFHELHCNIWQGKFTLADTTNRLLYGRLHWARLQHNLQQPRFRQSLEIVQQATTDSTPRLFPTPV